MNDLRKRSASGRFPIRQVRRQDLIFVHSHILENDCPARSGSLSKARPIINDRQPLAPPIDDGDHPVSIKVGHAHRYPMRKESTGTSRIFPRSTDSLPHRLPASFGFPKPFSLPARPRRFPDAPLLESDRRRMLSALPYLSIGSLRHWRNDFAEFGPSEASASEMIATTSQKTGVETPAPPYSFGTVIPQRPL